jgi:PhzF family phenazine biosynthesis protein
MPTLSFSQVDVFSEQLHRGNPVAVVHGAQDLSDEAMAAFARWTNLSETTFLLPPTRPGADYALRIFTPGGELPFAGHPTLGSCHAWLEAGGCPGRTDVLVQECDACLVTLRRKSGRLAFAAPPLRRAGPIESERLRDILDALDLDAADVIAHQWVDNGPGWCAVLLDSAERVLALAPDMARLGDTVLGVVGPITADDDVNFEVRAFVPSLGVPEDPVTGSLNAGIAQWLIGEGLAPTRYRARQGTVLGRAGRIEVAQEGPDIWIGGSTKTVVRGEVDFGIS